MKFITNYKQLYSIMFIMVAIFTYCNEPPTPTQSKFKTTHRIEVEKATKVLNEFINAFDSYDTATIRSLCYEEAKLYNIYTDSIREYKLNDWLKDFSIIKNIPEHPWNIEKAKKEIIHVHIADNAATANVEWVYPTYKYIEYFNLQRIDDKWVIMNRVWNGTKFETTHTKK